MAAERDNQGIWIEDSATVIAGAMAAGPGAMAQGSAQYAISAPADLESLRSAIGALVQQLRAAPEGVADAAALADVAASAAHEAAKSRPDKRILGGLLQVLSAGAGNAAAIADAVVSIQHAVRVLL
jgi:hypothetical protein